MRTFRYLALAAIPLLAGAQSRPSMSAPRLGYVFDDNAKAVRAVAGVPGAASLEEALAFGVGIDSAFVHSRARLALANLKAGSVALLRWDESARALPLATSISRAVLAAFSRSGDRAAITDGADGVEIWSGLRGDPQLQARYSGEAIGGVITAIAVNDEGTAVAGLDTGKLISLGDTGHLLASGGRWTGLAFLPDGHELVASEGTRVVALRNLGAEAVLDVLVENLPAGGALAVSADGARIAVANRETNGITLLDPAGALAAVDCRCTAERFELLEGNFVLRIVDPQAATALLLDADGGRGMVASIPGFSGRAGAGSGK